MRARLHRPLSSTGATWAYGNIVTVSFHGTSAGDTPYTGNATYGYTVLIHQTNLSGTDFQLSSRPSPWALRSRSSTAHPLATRRSTYGALADRLWETDNATVNLTDAGTVYEGGTAVSAFALISSTTQQAASFTEATSSYLPTSLGVGVARSQEVHAQVTASTSLTFATPLGLFPANLSSAQEWNSTSAFDANANASFAYGVSHAGPLANWNLSGHGNFPVERSGNVSVVGSFAPSDSVVLGGITYPEVGLVIQGPFGSGRGLSSSLPRAICFAGATAQPWSSNDTGQATAGMTFLDVRPLAGGHFGLGALGWVYDSQSLEPTSVIPASPASRNSPRERRPTRPPRRSCRANPESTSQSSATQGC